MANDSYVPQKNSWSGRPLGLQTPSRPAASGQAPFSNKTSEGPKMVGTSSRNGGCITGKKKIPVKWGSDGNIYYVIT